MAEQRNNPHRRRAAHARTPQPSPGSGAPAPTGSDGHDWFYPATGQTGPPAGPGGADHRGGADWPPPGADYPSWPAGADQYGWVPGADHPSWPVAAVEPYRDTDHPSWPASAVEPYPGADHPSWPAGAAGPDWPQPGTDYSSWPAGSAGYDWSPDPGGTSRPRREPPVAQHHERRWQTPAPVPATRYEYPYPARPAGGAHASTGRWSAQLARKQDTATQTYYELAFGDGRLQVMLTEPPAASREWATGMHARSVEVLPAAGNQAAPAVWEAVDLRNTDAVQVAERILSDADQQAAEMRRQASQQAVAVREAAEQEAADIRQQASAQAVPVREAAEREAAEIRQQATAQASAIRAAAEHEAAAVRAAAQQEADALRSAVELMSADLDQVAAYLTEKVTGPIERISGAARPTEGYPEPADGSAGRAARPGTAATGPRMFGTTPAPAVSPGAKPATVPDALPSPQQEADSDEEAATAPGEAQARPAGPVTGPTRRVGKPGSSRQYRTMRVFAGSIAALVTVALGTGAYQLATHGYTFFVFRSAGTGATNGNAVFPGHSPAPKPSPTHHQPTTGRDQHGARGAHHHRHPGGTHRRVKSQ